MLFRQSQWADLAAGKIRVAYRRWTRPTVKAGGRLRTPLCILAIDDVTKLPKSARITKADAAAAGFASVQQLKDALKDDGDLYRVRFHPADGAAGVDERATLRTTIAEADDDVAKLAAALAKLDAKKPWTLDMLALLDARPATRAVQLAASVARETFDFKDDVRKLKALGLTESLAVGYRLSPRGRAWLARHRPLATRPADEHAPRFDDDVAAAISRARRVGMRATPADAFVDIWPVVVEGRVFVRTSAVVTAIHVQQLARTRAPTANTIDVAAVAVAGSAEHMLDAIDTEYRRKFNTKNAVAVVAELCTPASRATTIELRPR